MIQIITGANGFLGNRYIEYLSEMNEKYLILDSDLSNEDFLVKAIDDKFTIIHFAGSKDNDLDKSLRNNIVVTAQMARLAQNKNCKGIIYVSSIAVYGAAKDIVDENSAMDPVTNYAKSKFICEEILKSFTDHVSCIIIRPTNIYDDCNVGILKEIANCIQQQKEFSVWRQSYKSSRDYIAINDLMSVIYLLNNTMKKSTEIIHDSYNVGSGFSYTIEEIINIFEKEMGCTVKKRIEDNDSFLAYNLKVDVTKIKRALGEKVVFENLGECIRGIYGIK